MKTFRLFAALLSVALIGAPVSAQDNSELASLLDKARRGNGIAQYNLGLAYAEGNGTSVDPIEAYVWLSLARENGARGRALDAIIGTLDKNALDRAARRLENLKEELGVRTPSAINVRTETSEVAPKQTDPTPAPAAPVKTTPAKPAAPSAEDLMARLTADRDTLSSRVQQLTAEVAALRTDRERILALSADHEKSARAADDAIRAAQEQARGAEGRATALSRAADTAKNELESTRLTLTALQNAPKPTADNAALAQKNRELQAALAELESARAFGRQVEDTLNKVNDDRARVAANAAAELEAARSFGQQVETTLNKVSDQKSALAVQIEAAKQDIAKVSRARDEAIAALAAKPAAPTYPDLSGRVAELEAAYTAASTSLAQAQAALAAKPVSPSFPDLRDRVTTLERELVAARTSAPAYPDLRSNVTQLETKVTELTAENTRAKQQVTAAAQSGEASLRTLNRELDATKAALAKANDSLSAKPVAPTYPDLSGRVAELETQLAKKPSAPAYPNLSGKVAELESQLSAAKATAADNARAASQAQAALAAKPAAPAYPDLSGKVTELETALASATQKSSAAEQARAEAAKQFDDYKSSTAAAQRERTTLLANVKMLESDKAALRRQAESAGSEAEQMRSQVAALKSQLVAQPAAPTYPDLSARVSELETQLAQAKAAAPAYPDLSGKVAELTSVVDRLAKENTRLTASAATSDRARTESAALLAAKEKAAPAYPDLTGRVAELESAYTTASTSLAQAQAALAAQPAAPSYPDLREQVATLERDLNEARASAPAYPDMRERVTALESDLAAAKRSVANTERLSGDLAASKQHVEELEAQVGNLKTALAAPAAYPDLRGRVTELEAALANTKTAGAADAQLRKERDELSSRVTNLSGEVSQLRNDRERMQKMLADAGRKLSDTTAEANHVKELEAALIAEKTSNEKLQQSYDSIGQNMERQLQAANAALAAKPAAPTYPDLRGQVAELQDQVSNLKTALAAPAAYPDLSGKVRELETQLATARKPSAPAYPDLSSRVAELETQLAKQPSGPAYPNLTGRVAELESQLAASEQRRRTPAYPDLSDRVNELQSSLADNRRQLSEAQAQLASRPATVESAPDTSALEQKLAETEGRLTTALRGYALLEKNQEASTAKITEANSALTAEKNALSSQVESLTEQVAQLRSANAAQAGAVSTTAALSTEKEALAARLADMETRAASAQAEVTRLGESLAALQRSSGQSTTEATAAATLVRQLQGANSVLASENYQLKTMLSRTTGAPAPAAPSAVPGQVAAARTHVIVPGDSLSKISQLYYGTAGRWQEIYNANVDKLGPNGILRIGTELRIP